jgi:hypothetical protein
VGTSTLNIGRGSVSNYKNVGFMRGAGGTGRQIREDKRGHISSALPSILNRLGIDHATWMSACTQLEKGNMVGCEASIQQAMPTLKRKRMSGFRLPDS